MRLVISFLVSFVCLVGCQTDDCPVFYDYQDQFSYEVEVESFTPQGIAVDLTGQDISLELVDGLVNEVEDCLIETFGDPPIIPEDVMEGGMCLYNTFQLPIRCGCLIVKVPDDWTFSCIGNEQVLPSLAPDELCDAKGLTPTPECPCRWRSGIQDDLTIVTTPNFQLFKDPLIRIVTGCNNPWGHPALARCALPSTPPL